ncbi:MAG: hypothetical protein FJ306_10250 [Planctomycetes bacterium]|nr:hypothetical protein [Planctomycetota bacterium]
MLPFTLHARELGRHTLYVIYNDKDPVGFVHARSESSSAGMVEIVWSLDLDLRIRDFRFQRCRAGERSVFEQSQFAAGMRGLTFDQLRASLTEDGTELARAIKPTAAGCEELALVATRSALTTLLVTQLTFGEAVRPEFAIALARRLPGSVAVEAVDGTALPTWRCLDRSGHPIGQVVFGSVRGASGTASPARVDQLGIVIDGQGCIRGFCGGHLLDLQSRKALADIAQREPALVAPGEPTVVVATVQREIERQTGATPMR